MIKSRVVRDKSQVNSSTTKFHVIGGDFKNVEAIHVDDLAALTLDAESFIVEPVEPVVGSAPTLYYGRDAEMSFVIAINEQGEVTTPPAVYYIDGYSLNGLGTQADPIRYTGTFNSIGGGSTLATIELEDTDEKITVVGPNIWFDGVTIGKRPEDSVPTWSNGSGIGNADGINFVEVGQPFSIPLSTIFN